MPIRKRFPGKAVPVHDEEQLERLKAVDRFLRAGQLDKALATLENCLDSDPDDWQLEKRLAELYARANRKDDAIRHYRRIAWRFLNDPDENPLKAVAIYKVILRLDPTDEDARQALAKLSS